MGQEACEIEDCFQENNKRKGDIHMLRKTKRTLSLVLALIMICATMGIMAFAAENGTVNAYCLQCNNQRDFTFLRHEETFNRIVECTSHLGLHDAEEWHVRDVYGCNECEFELVLNGKYVYICIR